MWDFPNAVRNALNPSPSGYVRPVPKHKRKAGTTRRFSGAECPVWFFFGFDGIRIYSGAKGEKASVYGLDIS